MKLVVIILLVAALGGGAFTFAKMGKKGKHAEKKVELTAWKLEEFIVNLADIGEPRYLKVNIVLEVEECEAKPAGGEGGEEAKAPEDPKVRDTIIAVLTTRRFAELLTDKGKTQLKAKLKTELNKVLEKAKVHNIYFTSFAMQ